MHAKELNLAPPTLGGSFSHDNFNDMVQTEYFILATLYSLRICNIRVPKDLAGEQVHTVTTKLNNSGHAQSSEASLLDESIVSICIATGDSSRAADQKWLMYLS